MQTLEEKVLAYQKTKCEAIFNEIYEEVRGYFWPKVARYQDVHEVMSRVNMTVFECVMNFDINKGKEFKMHLLCNIDYAISKAFRYENTHTFGYLDNYKDRLKSDSSVLLDVERKADYEMFLETIKNKDDRLIINSLAKGVKIKDIAKKLGCTPHNVTMKVKRFKDLYPYLRNYL